METENDADDAAVVAAVMVAEEVALDNVVGDILDGGELYEDGEDPLS